jgi:hypothetical protein
MTVLSRGARVRRGGRRPGWVLLTALLVLAMGASSALVFTNRVELLKLAVILALWAAVSGAFVSVLYRRQSDADQSRVRDLKLVYDLQLDREISARREYELTVESQLRRELASELRAAAADDLAALRAELAALRTSLEILFDTDLEHRPALGTLGTEVPPTRAYSDWDRNGENKPVDWVSSDRVTSVRQDNPLSPTDRRADEDAIIDVPEEPLLPPRQPPPPRERVRVHYESPYMTPLIPPQAEPESRFEPRHRPPAPPPPEPQPEPEPEPPDWQPVTADGAWLPPGAPGSHWAGIDSADAPAAAPSGRRRRARHYSPDEPGDGPTGEAESAPQYGESGRRARARHSSEYPDYGKGGSAGVGGGGMSEPSSPQPSATPPAAPPPPPPPSAPPVAAAPPPPRLAPPPPPEPAPRHRGADPVADRPDGQAPQTGGHSVADLLARLQIDPTGGGRRRRRDG